MADRVAASDFTGEALCAPDGSHVLDPPEDIRKSAARLGFAASELRATGGAAVEFVILDDEGLIKADYMFPGL